MLISDFILACKGCEFSPGSASRKTEMTAIQTQSTMPFGERTSNKLGHEAFLAAAEDDVPGHARHRRPSDWKDDDVKGERKGEFRGQSVVVCALLGLHLLVPVVEVGRRKEHDA